MATTVRPNGTPHTQIHIIHMQTQTDTGATPIKSTVNEETQDRGEPGTVRSSGLEDREKRNTWDWGKTEEKWHTGGEERKKNGILGAVISTLCANLVATLRQKTSQVRTWLLLMVCEIQFRSVFIYIANCNVWAKLFNRRSEPNKARIGGNYWIVGHRKTRGHQRLKSKLHFSSSDVWVLTGKGTFDIIKHIV